MSNNPIRINPQTNQDRILRANEVVTLTGLSRTTVWRLERLGNFPARRQLSPGAVGWFVREIEKWIAERQAVSNISGKLVASQPRRGRKPRTRV